MYITAYPKQAALEKKFETSTLSSGQLQKLLLSLRQEYPEIISGVILQGCGESKYVLLLIAPEVLVYDFVQYTEKLLTKKELRHLFPAQVRFHALGELLRGKVFFHQYFRDTKDVHSPFADVLFLPQNWRLEAAKWEQRYFSTVPYYFSELARRSR